MSSWITRRRAAEILGVSTNTVDRLITVGELTPRPDLTWRGGKASLDPAQVQLVAERRITQQVEAELRRRDRDDRRMTPPDGEHEWLSASQAARVIGISEMGLRKRVARGAAPVTRHRGRQWFRRDQMEILGNARAARRTGGVVAAGQVGRAAADHGQI